MAAISAGLSRPRMRANKAVTGSPGIRRGRMKLMVSDTQSVSKYRPICFNKYFIAAF